MIKRWLTQARPPLFVAYCIAAAFCPSFCMYAFRKPFVAATFEGLEFLGTGINLKTTFVISQIIGYTISKYVGCKFCSEIGRHQQAKALFGMDQQSPGIQFFAVPFGQADASGAIAPVAPAEVPVLEPVRVAAEGH